MNKIIDEILNEEDQKKSGEKSDNCCAKDDTAVMKQRIFNWFVIGFSIVMTIVALVTFFISLSNGSADAAAAIVSTYVLCMLLAAPTIKVFLDKCTCKLLRWLNIVTIILIFAVILLTVVITFFSYAGFLG